MNPSSPTARSATGKRCKVADNPIEKRPPPTVEEFLMAHLSLPGTFVTNHERNFIADMRHYSAMGVGLGWMKQMIEIEFERKIWEDFQLAK